MSLKIIIYLLAKIENGIMYNNIPLHISRYKMYYHETCVRARALERISRRTIRWNWNYWSLRGRRLSTDPWSDTANRIHIQSTRSHRPSDQPHNGLPGVIRALCRFAKMAVRTDASSSTLVTSFAAPAQPPAAPTKSSFSSCRRTSRPFHPIPILLLLYTQRPLLRARTSRAVWLVGYMAGFI